MPYAIDWSSSFVPAVTLWLNGLDPYTAVFFNPPWVLPILAPFVILGEAGRILFLTCAITAFAFTSYRLGARPLAVAAFTLCPFTFDSLAWGNVEWIAILGLVIPGPIGLLLMMVKPQMTVAVILFRVFESWQSSGWHSVMRLCFIPVIITLVSFILFGFYPAKMLSYQPTLGLSLFPWSVPVGIYLLIVSFRYRSIYYAIAASPMLFPSVTPQVWLVTFLALVSDAPSLVLASLSYWSLILSSS